MRLILKFHHLATTLPPLRHYGLLWLLGLCSALAFPPFSFWPALIPGFTALLWVITSTRSGRKAFAAGWWFGFGHFTAGLYWIALALLTDPSQYGWMIPFAIFGISAVLALYSGLATLATYLMPLEGMVRKVIVFAASWVIAETLRTHLFTGFPWNLTGYSWSRSVEMMQLASITGIEGLSFLAVITGSIAATLIDSDTKTRCHWRPVIFTCVLLAVVWGGGYLRLPAPGNYPATPITLRIIQPNITQDHKWRPELRFKTLERHIDLSRLASAHPVDFLIWPEAAVPYTIDPNSNLLPLIRQVIPTNGFLLTGALREEGDETNYHLWNSLFALDSKGAIVSYYDKVHLVPFGEYIPLRALLPINKITYGTTDFSSGPGPKTLSVSLHAPSFAPLICYEAIFPEGIVAQDRRPSWLLNITNDAWFGMSSGPYQHFEMVRMRSIEQGLPLVRAANTGISGIIDAYGRITAALPLGTEGVLEGNLPSALSPTLYNKYGNYIILLVIVAIVLFLFLTQPFYNSNDKRV